MLIIPNVDTPKQMAEREYAQHLAEMNKATIDYVAMMCDVEIPQEEKHELRED